MKVQFILLIVCVVATFALPDRSGDDETRNERRRHYKGGRQNQVSPNDDESRDSSISPNEPTTEKSRCSWGRRENRRPWQKHGDGEESRRRNSSDVNDEDADTYESDEKEDSPLTDGDSENDRRHHRHHGHRRHHHHHHHHKNHTTTTTTTTTSTPLSDIEE